MRPVDLLGGKIGKDGDCGKIEGSVPCEVVLSSSRRLPRNDKSPGRPDLCFSRISGFINLCVIVTSNSLFQNLQNGGLENNTKANKKGWIRLMAHPFEASEGNTRWKDVHQNVNRYCLWLVGFKVI